MFAIECTQVFHAHHALRLPAAMGGGIEPSHTHAFAVTLRIESNLLDPLETVLDFHEVERALEAVIAPWRGANLNDLEPFKSQINPSAERIAEHIASALASKLPLPIAEVRITEAPNCLAIYRP